MAKKLLYMATHGPEDPTRAALVFSAANGAREVGLEATVALVGDAVMVMNDATAKATIGLGRAPLDVLIDKAIAKGQNQVKIFV